MARMRALAIAWALAAALLAPGLLWAAGDEPASTATTPTTETTPAAPAQATTPAPTPPEPAPAKPAPAAGAKQSPDASARAQADEPKRLSTQPVARAAASGSVTIRNFSFSPGTITVNVGDTVTWTNQDSAPHNAVADDGSFQTPNLNRGQSDSVTLENAGTFAYTCTIHPNMRGTVVVRGAGAGAAGAGGNTGVDDTGGGSSGSTSTGTSSGSSLPSTGLDALLLALAGFALVGGGLALRRRLGATPPSETP